MRPAAAKVLMGCFECASGFTLKSLSLIISYVAGAYTLVAVGSSGILKGKQKLGVIFNSDKLGGIDFTKFSKLTTCSA